MPNINWYKFPAQRRPKIEMLEDSMWYESGYRYIIQVEDDNGLYFDGIDKKWTVVEKKYEGKVFIYVRKGNDSPIKPRKKVLLHRREDDEQKQE